MVTYISVAKPAARRWLQQPGFQPEVITYTALISVCSRGGMAVISLLRFVDMQLRGFHLIVSPTMQSSVHAVATGRQACLAVPCGIAAASRYFRQLWSPTLHYPINLITFTAVICAGGLNLQVVV